MRSAFYKRGFTLIEMSIVLLVIALLTAGIVVGQSMIRQSQLLSIITDETRYVKAALAFRDKYNALPGDMTNATLYWGVNTTGAGCPPTTSYSAPQPNTCNGDGSGVINNDGTTTSTSTTTVFENFLAWQQMGNAGFIQGSYTGAPGPSTTYTYSDNEPGVNVPLSKVAGGGFEWAAFNANSLYPASAFYNVVYYQQYLMLGGRTGSDLLAPILTQSEASGIDTKMDDGNPSTGIVTTPNESQTLLSYYAANTCVNATTAVYSTNSTVAKCMLLFLVKW